MPTEPDRRSGVLINTESENGNSIIRIEYSELKMDSGSEESVNEYVSILSGRYKEERVRVYKYKKDIVKRESQDGHTLHEHVLMQCLLNRQSETIMFKLKGVCESNPSNDLIVVTEWIDPE